MTLNMKNYKGYDKMPYCEPHYPKTVASVVVDTPEMRRVAENTKNQSQVQYHAAYEKSKGTKIDVADDPEMERHRKNMQAQSQIAYSGELDKRKKMEEVRPTYVPAEASRLRNVVCTSLQENGVPASSSGTYNTCTYDQQSTLIYSTDSVTAVQQPERVVGSIADYDPLNGSWGTAAQSRTSDKIKEMNVRNAGGLKTQPFSPSGAAGFAVKAIYDYTAADKDEVSFLEGDIIVNCEKVDDGWMTGTVQRTLQWGMLPANYVQPHKVPTGLARFK